MSFKFNSKNQLSFQLKDLINGHFDYIQENMIGIKVMNDYFRKIYFSVNSNFVTIDFNYGGRYVSDKAKIVYDELIDLLTSLDYTLKFKKDNEYEEDEEHFADYYGPLIYTEFTNVREDIIDYLKYASLFALFGIVMWMSFVFIDSSTSVGFFSIFALIHTVITYGIAGLIYYAFGRVNKPKIYIYEQMLVFTRVLSTKIIRIEDIIDIQNNDNVIVKIEGQKFKLPRSVDNQNIVKVLLEHKEEIINEKEY